MSREELEQKVISYFSLIFKNKGNITTETRFTEDLDATSIQLMSVLACVEEEMDVVLSLTDAVNCTCVGDFVDKVAAELK